MREIEFRGKTDKNIWVFGNFVKTKEEYTKEISNAIINLDAEHRCCGEYLDNGWNEIDINTLGQYTGLKDKNGTKIFEGDIVKACSKSTNRSDRYCLVFDETRLHFGFRVARHGYFYNIDELLNEELGDEIDFEVIGNIYDNPDLLEVGDV